MAPNPVSMNPGGEKHNAQMDAMKLLIFRENTGM